MLQLSRNGLRLQSLTSLDESQGSSNVKVSIQNDRTYTNYSTQLHYGYYVHGFSYTKGIARYENDVFILPREAFEQYGLLNLSVLLVSSDEELMTNQVQFIVQAAPRGDMIIDDIPSAQQQVLQLVQTTLDQYANTINLNKNEIAVLKSRMDSFTQLQEGSTTGDAELIDGRVGYDGKTYENIGGAIRGQVSQLSDDIINLELPIGELTNSEFVHYTTGVFRTSESYVRTNYLPCSSMKYLEIESGQINDNSGLAFYDENYKFISGLQINVLDNSHDTYKKTEVTVPNNAVYFAFSSLKYGYENGETIKVIIPTKGVVECVRETEAVVDNIDDYIVNDIAFKSEIEITEITNGKYIKKTNGNELEASDSCVTTFIEILPASKIFVKDGYFDDNRGACAYDALKRFVADITPTDNVMVIPENAVYIRVTGKANVKPSLKYIGLSEYTNAQALQNENLSNYAKNVIEVTEFQSGYIRSDGTTILESTEYQHSDYIEVLSNRMATISNLYSAGGSTVHFYDHRKNYLRSHTTDDYTEYYNYYFLIPENVGYLRFNTKSSVSNVLILYDDKILHNQNMIDVFNNINTKTNGYINTLYNHAMSYPAITIIDDDTRNPDTVAGMVNFCNEMGIKCSFAVLTDNVDSHEGFSDYLLELERQGFTMLIHANTQGDCFLQDSNRDIVECENNFVTGLQKMHKYGFTDYKFWCTPFGVEDDDMVKLARKWGMECLINAGYRGLINNYDVAPDARYHIKRNSFSYASDEESFKETILKCAREKGWVLICTHFAKIMDLEETEREEILQALRNVIYYAIGKGCKFTTVNEEFRRRKAIYDMIDNF